tara:strand:- start:176 stop:580 length:405 start_codon:yes stop_codon:yes gene_type:complete
MSKTHCKWIEDDEQMLVQPDGQVLPCCYLSNYFAADKTPAVLEKEIRDGKINKTYVNNNYREIEDQLYNIELVNFEFNNEYILQEYTKRKDKLNIFTNDLEDILNNEWFVEILPKSWEDPDKISLPCKNICTKK